MSISLISAVLGQYSAWIQTESVQPVNETQTTIFLATQWNFEKLELSCLIVLSRYQNYDFGMIPA